MRGTQLISAAGVIALSGLAFFAPRAVADHRTYVRYRPVYYETDVLWGSYRDSGMEAYEAGRYAQGPRI